MKRILILLLALLPSLLWAQGVLSELNNMHTVVKGETVTSIAAVYNISPEQLLAANPDVRRGKVKKGMLLIIPKAPVPAATTTVEVTSSLAPTVRTSLQTVHAAVFLPFSGAEADRKQMVEFYRGMLMAADSVKREGFNVEISTWDCARLSDDATPLAEKIKDMDVVFASVPPMQADMFDGSFVQPVYVYGPTYFLDDPVMQTFKSRYESAFHVSQQQRFPRFAALGFDMAYCFLHGLCKHGDTFSYRQSNLSQQTYQTRLLFHGDSQDTNFRSRTVQLISFSNIEN